MKRSIVAALLIVAGMLGSAPPAAAQEVVWVRTFDRFGPNGCLEWVAEWSDGTYTAAVVDCAGQEVGAGDLTYLGYFETIGPDGCREGVSYWSNGEFTWVPLECPPGVVYVKPDWDQRAPWNHHDPYGVLRPPARVRPGSTAPTRSPATARPAPRQPASPARPPAASATDVSIRLPSGWERLPPSGASLFSAAYTRSPEVVVSVIKGDRGDFEDVTEFAASWIADRQNNPAVVSDVTSDAARIGGCQTIRVAYRLQSTTGDVVSVVDYLFVKNRTPYIMFFLVDSLNAATVSTVVTPVANGFQFTISGPC